MLTRTGLTRTRTTTRTWHTRTRTRTRPSRTRTRTRTWHTRTRTRPSRTRTRTRTRPSRTRTRHARTRTRTRTRTRHSRTRTRINITVCNLESTPRRGINAYHCIGSSSNLHLWPNFAPNRRTGHNTSRWIQTTIIYYSMVTKWLQKWIFEYIWSQNLISWTLSAKAPKFAETRTSSS